MDPSMEIRCVDVKIEKHDIDSKEEDRLQNHEIIVKTELVVTKNHSYYFFDSLVSF